MEILAQDSADYYAVQLALYNHRNNELSEGFSNAVKPLIDFAAQVKAPAPASAHEQSLAKIAEELTSVRQTISPGSGLIEFRFASSGDPFKDGSLTAMQALMIPVRVVGENAMANRDALIAYHQALGDYMALIDQAALLLRQVQDAAARAPDVIAGVSRLGAIRTDLESDAISTRSALLRAIAALQ